MKLLFQSFPLISYKSSWPVLSACFRIHHLGRGLATKGLGQRREAGTAGWCPVDCVPLWLPQEGASLVLCVYPPWGACKASEHWSSKLEAEWVDKRMWEMPSSPTLVSEFVFSISQSPFDQIRNYTTRQKFLSIYISDRCVIMYSSENLLI